VLTTANKRLLISESRGDSNRCTPCKGNLIHVTYTSCASPRMPLVRFPWTVPVCGNLSRWPNRVGQIHYSQEKVLPTPPLSPAVWPTGPASVSLPNTTIEAVCLSQITVDEHDNRLTRPISPACDQYIQYLLTRANSSVLNWHRRGGNPGGADFPHLNPQPSQPMDLHIPPKSPARYQVINPIPIELEMEQTINLMSGSLHSTSTRSYHLNIA
jgi:hypothetical protein